MSEREHSSPTSSARGGGLGRQLARGKGIDDSAFMMEVEEEEGGGEEEEEEREEIGVGKDAGEGTSTVPSPSRKQPVSSGSGTPVLKRRRVARACDECRSKKIKCDGKQPCMHCVVYSYECTYDRPSNRKRHTQPQQVEALEQRLRRAEAVLHTLLPNIDLQDPKWDQLVGQAPERAVADSSGKQRAVQPTVLQATVEGSIRLENLANEPDLESMISATGQLDIDERGFLDYHGHSSGVSFLRKMTKQISDIVEPTQAIGDSRASKSPASGLESPFESVLANLDELPPYEKALELCSLALDDACAILRVVHQPTFYYHLERIYQLSPESYENQDNTFLALLYVVLAVGCLFAKDERSDLERKGYESATDQGYRYFWAARQLMDITDCRDLTSLQAIVFMIMFLQCSAKLSTCYSLVGLALRSAIRLGLHRSSSTGFRPGYIELETRKRVFCVIRIMDIQVGALQGLPFSMNDEDTDQELPVEAEDEAITDAGIRRSSSQQPAPIVASNANFKLCKIVAKIVRRIYPIQRSSSTTEGQISLGSYTVNLATIKEIEQDLESWRSDLPPMFRPGSPAPPQIVRIQKLLRISFAYAQVMLYRPFLHYVSATPHGRLISQRAYDCAAACISVSRNIVHITTEMQRLGLLVGSYWFTMYTTFFAILSLLFFVIEDPESAARQNVMSDARDGRDALARLAKRSMTADRCTKTLTGIFENIGDLGRATAAGAELLGARARQRGSATRRRSESTAARQTPQSGRSGRQTTASRGSRSAQAATQTRSATTSRAANVGRSSGADRPAGSRASSSSSSSRRATPSRLSQRAGVRAAAAAAAAVASSSSRRASSGVLQSTAGARAAAAGLAQVQYPATALVTSSQTTVAATAATAAQSPREEQQVKHYQYPTFSSHAMMSLRQNEQLQLQQQQQMHTQFYQAYPTDTSSLQDITSMMFPSADPFAYPNHPMMTMAGASDSQQGYAFQPSNYMRGDAGSSLQSGQMQLSNPDDHLLDVQLFEPMPSYMTGGTLLAPQQRQQAQQPRCSSSLETIYAQSQADTGRVGIGQSSSVSSSTNIFHQTGFQAPSQHLHPEIGQTGGMNVGVEREQHSGGANIPVSGAAMWNQQARSHGLLGLNMNTDIQMGGTGTSYFGRSGHSHVQGFQPSDEEEVADEDDGDADDADNNNDSDDDDDMHE